MGKSLGLTTVLMRNSGGAPTLMWTSEALFVTAARRMSLIRLIRSFLSVTLAHREASRAMLLDLRSTFGRAQDLIDRGHALHHLIEPILPERYQAALAAQFS